MLVIDDTAIANSLGNLNRSGNIQQQHSNSLTVARLTKGFTSQVDALAKLRHGGEQRDVVEHVDSSTTQGHRT